MQNQQQKSSLIQVLLWGAVIYLGFSLFAPKGPTGPEKSYTELLTEMRANNRDILDQTIAMKTFPAFQNAVDKTKMSDADKDKLKLEGEVLVADTQCKAAAQRKDINRVITANDALLAWQRRIGNTPLWTTPITVAAHKDFPQTQYTPQEMKERARALSSDLGKNTPVWGFFPGYDLINFLVHVTGAVPGFSYALACLLLALSLRILIYPLTQKQIVFGRQMSQLSPLMNEIKEKYKRKDGKQADMKDQQAMNAEIMGLYEQYGLHPASGCWPMFLQMPLFLMIYQSMQHYRFEFEQGHFLWICDALSKSTHGFIAANLGQKDYILIVIYAISMVITTLLTPVSDPANAKQSRMIGLVMSVSFGVMMFFWPVPSAFVLYWVFTNILAAAQSLYFYRMPVQPLVKKKSSAGGVITAPLSSTIPGTPGKTGVPQRHKPKKKK